MITSSPFESTWLKIFASGSRVGPGAGAAAVGLGARCCWGRIPADSVDGDSKVKRSKKTSERRFTDNSICCKLMLAEGKRLSCHRKIVQEGFRGIIGPIGLIRPISFYSQSRALFDGGLFDKRQHRSLPHLITIEFGVCLEASFRRSSALSRCVDHWARTK